MRRSTAVDTLPAPMTTATDPTATDPTLDLPGQAEGLPLPSLSPLNQVLKRCGDLVIALLALLFFAPLLVLIALMIRLDSPGPALFRQKRVGRHGKLFTLLKFRTMRLGTPHLSTREMAERGINPVTPLGAVLRRYSLDELPQCINILRNEMSLVGPRPALPTQETVNRLRDAAGVHDLLPGITGWAQVNGRDNLSDEEKVAHDAYYRLHLSPHLDLRIIMLTFVAVLTGRGNR